MPAPPPPVDTATPVTAIVSVPVAEPLVAVKVTVASEVIEKIVRV